jgi:molybdate transport system regulatory protein
MALSCSWRMLVAVLACPWLRNECVAARGIKRSATPVTGLGVDMADTKLTLRVDFGRHRAVGPGKVLLLEAIRDQGSISQAARTLGMSYRRAWLLVDDMNRCFREPVVDAQPGGAEGGRATLTRMGATIVRNYRAIEAEAQAATRVQMGTLEEKVRRSKAVRGVRRSVCVPLLGY